MAVDSTDTSRRGRPRAGEREAREQAIAQAAMAELIEHGFDGVTMLKVAKRAGASKETLYSWFGNREGLFAALITNNADTTAANVERALQQGGSPEHVLTSFAVGLLRLLTGEESVALNRAAMSSPELSQLLLTSGRHRVGPLVEEYLGELGRDGTLRIDDPADSFTLLYGLIVEDVQIRVLLGDDPPDLATIERHAARAVQRFFVLCGSVER